MSHTLLTPDEIDLLQEQYDCFGDCDAPRIHDLARAIEAAVLAKAGKGRFPTSADRIAYGATSDRHTDFEGCHSEFAMTSYGRKCADAQRNLDAETVAKSAAYAARLREALAYSERTAERLKIRSEAYEEAYRIAYQATFQSHNGHWDSTMRGGLGCPECIRAKEARENCDKALRDGLNGMVALAESATTGATSAERDR